MPASIGTSALDIDEGDPRELLAHHPAWAVIASRRPGGCHAYYRDDRPRNNSKWSRYGCTGEIRSGRGYLVLWRDGAERLAEEIEAGGDGGRFPADLFEAAGVELPTHHAPRTKGPPVIPPRAVVLPMLEVIQEGDRNRALFDTVRFWAYAQDRGDDLDSWHARILEYATAQNQRFPDPLHVDEHGRDEVRRIAWNVASWTWSGGGPFDHSPPAQSRRGVASGRARRREKADRDRAILADHLAGLSLRAIAKRYGLSHTAVRKVLLRDAPLFSGDGRRLLGTVREPKRPPMGLGSVST